MTVAVAERTQLGDGLTALDARDIAARVQRGDVSARDVVLAHLERIHAMQPVLGALSVVREHEALHEADSLQQRTDLGALRLAGVPVVVKENFGVAGLPTLHGSAATSRRPKVRDDLVVRRLRDAGAIVVAKTHMPELAIWPVTESAICTTRNPFDITRTPGGSSGGTAAAVASGMAPLGLGSDGGGSIRIPSACCGLVGVKPTPHLVPLGGDAESHWRGLSVAGPLARTVADAALLLDVLSGSSAFRSVQNAPRGLRVSVSTKHPLVAAPVDAAVQAAVATVADALQAAGHKVTRDDPPYPLVPTAFVSRWLCGVADDVDALSLQTAELEPRTRALVAEGRAVRHVVRVGEAPASSQGRRLRRWLSRRDVLVSPVLAHAPPEVGRWWGQPTWLTFLSAGRWMGFNPPWNLAGCPAVTVPVTRDTNGLPLVVQLVARPGSERLLLSVAALLEERLPGVR